MNLMVNICYYLVSFEFQLYPDQQRTSSISSSSNENYDSIRKLEVPEKAPISFEDLADFYADDSSFDYFQTHFQDWLSDFFRDYDIISLQELVQFTEQDQV